MDISEHMRIGPLDTHVRVEIDGVAIADSRRPMVLREKGFPPRYYLPREDVRFDLLERTEATTHCPIKGDASYFSAKVGDTVHKDVVWSYESPIPEAEDVAGLVAFFDEKVDVYLDDELQERPVTKFS
ncbi:DUF427 domain-containing protein [Haloechinothrix halophila]|uniref:DUF427 domain-containing protein n=1 Tax=Haloechinothrix halophila TaxID=1069073 RepID=UPI000402E200|nr:DUF427 domain-containing protein [Haloechinothrix halophila]